MRSRTLVLTAVLALTSSGCGEPEAPSTVRDPAETRRALAGAPPPLAGLHAQAGQLLEGGPDAFRRRLRVLRGHAVVVNKWASWCPPCRAEFPFFESQALKHGRKVAFIGVDSNDSAADAKRFLERFPVSYPSFSDPNSHIAAVFRGVLAFPTTAYYDSQGRLAYVKQGGYVKESDLAADIARHAR